VVPYVHDGTSSTLQTLVDVNAGDHHPIRFEVAVQVPALAPAGPVALVSAASDIVDAAEGLFEQLDISTSDSEESEEYDDGDGDEE
jgi:hypothetical protein